MPEPNGYRAIACVGVQEMRVDRSDLPATNLEKKHTTRLLMRLRGGEEGEAGDEGVSRVSTQSKLPLVGLLD